MKITIISVGKLKEKYLIQGIEEYTKRLTRYTKIEIIEVSDEKAPEQLSDSEINQIKYIEGKRILNRVADRSCVFALDLNGAQRTSEAFAQEIEEKLIYGKSHLTFIIGGSLGLSSEVIQRSQVQISFGK